jgi:uncharacterized protein
MRRKDFEITDKSEIDDFMNGQYSGVISFAEKDKPYSFPVNYVYHKNNIFFHCSINGEKAGYFSEGRNVQFTVYKEYSFIPSYFTFNKTEDMSMSPSCNAGQFFKSVMVFGKLINIINNNDKIEVLGKIMEKHQPEGKYQKLKIEELENMLRATAVISVLTDKITAKFKFGQNQNEEKIRNIIDNLNDRGSLIDIETIRMINKYRI